MSLWIQIREFQIGWTETNWREQMFGKNGSEGVGSPQQLYKVKIERCWQTSKINESLSERNLEWLHTKLWILLVSIFGKTKPPTPKCGCYEVSIGSFFVDFEHTALVLRRHGQLQHAVYHVHPAVAVVLGFGREVEVSVGRAQGEAVPRLLGARRHAPRHGKPLLLRTQENLAFRECVLQRANHGQTRAFISVEAAPPCRGMFSGRGLCPRQWWEHQGRDSCATLLAFAVRPKSDLDQYAQKSEADEKCFGKSLDASVLSLSSVSACQTN